MIKWNEFKTTKEDYELISKIADRFINHTYNNLMLQNNQLPYQLDKMALSWHWILSMDLECAFNDVGLDLQRLLDAPMEDFIHDIGGILRNINRTTGKIDNCFLPRCS
jgi:hypothetical protein